MAHHDPTEPSPRDAQAQIDALARRLDETASELERLRAELSVLRDGLPAAGSATEPGPAPGSFILPPPLPGFPLPEPFSPEPHRASPGRPRDPETAAAGEPDQGQRTLCFPAGEEPGPPTGVAASIGEAGGSRPATAPPPLPGRGRKCPRRRQAEAAGRPRGEDLETRIGVYWFNRIGLVSLIVALALFAGHVHRALQPWHKTALLYAAAGGLSLTGLWLDQRLRVFARPLTAGGLALAFFASFAAHFIPATTCLPLAVSLALMLASVAGMLWCAERWRSESTAGLAIFLGHAAALTGSQDAGWFSAVAILFLSGTAVVMMLRHRWLPMSLLSVLAAFGSHYLWGARGPVLGSAAQTFWIHVGFLSSYYAVFLIGDGLVQRRLRRWTEAPAADTGRFAARACGPAAMILYATVATWAFFRTGLYLDRLHWFLLGLSVIQFGVAGMRRARGAPDPSLFLAAGVIFATLGLLNWFQGLTLNLFLAAEALLLLILGRRLRLWVLYPLAQGVLAVNFVHYWGSAARFVDTWPMFLGSLATSAVYLVKARLEETWPITVSPPGPSGPGWLDRMRSAGDRLAGPLGHIHGALAGVLLVYQVQRFFAEPMNSLVLAGALILLTVGSFRLPCRPWHWTMAGIQIALLLDFGRRWQDAGDPSAAIASSWLLHQWLCMALVVLAAGSIWWGQHRRIPFLVLVGMTHLAAAAGLIFFAAGIGVTPDEWPWLALAAPLGYWVLAASPRMLGPFADDDWSRAWPRWAEGLLIRGWAEARVITAIAGAALTVLTVLRVAPSHGEALWFLGGFAAAAAACAGLTGRGAPAVGVTVLLAASAWTRFAWPDLDRLFVSGRADAWLAFTCALAAAALAAGGVRRSRPLLAGAAVAALLLHLTMLVLLVFQRPAGFAPLWPWLPSLAAFYIAAECIAVGLRNREDMGWIGGHRFLISFLAATCGALVWGRMLALALPPGFPLWRAELVFAATFLALAAGLRSPTAAAGYGMHLILSQGIFLFSLFPGDRSAEAWFLASLAHPGWTAVLLSVTLAGGAGAEYALRRGLRNPPLRVKNWLRMGAGYADVSALLIGAIVGGIQTARFAEAPALVWAGQLMVAVAAAAGGAAMRLPGLTWSGALHGGLTVLILVFLAAVRPEHRVQLHSAGIAVVLQLILLERCLAAVQPLSPRATRWLRRTLAVLGGGMAAAAFQWSAEIGGSWTTLAWSLSALALMALGFLTRFSAYRRVALAILAAAVLRVVLIDLAGLDPGYRIAAFLALGLCLVLTSFLYSRNRDEFQKWL